MSDADIVKSAVKYDIGKCLPLIANKSTTDKILKQCDKGFGEGIPEFDEKCKKLQKIVDACADSESGDSEKGKEK